LASAIEELPVVDISNVHGVTESNVFVYPYPNLPPGGESGGGGMLLSMEDIVWVDFHWPDVYQDGTEDYPYSSLALGLENVPTSGTIRIKYGISSETPRITQPVRLEASGGPVRIGDPLAPQYNTTNQLLSRLNLFPIAPCESIGERSQGRRAITSIVARSVPERTNTRILPLNSLGPTQA
jgi:hypothetical protein